MTSHFFSVEITGQASEKMVTELASRILHRLGSPDEQLPALTAALHRALTSNARGSERRCDIQFRAQNGLLNVLVLSNGSRVWESSRPTS